MTDTSHSLYHSSSSKADTEQEPLCWKNYLLQLQKDYRAANPVIVNRLLEKLFQKLHNFVEETGYIMI